MIWFFIYLKYFTKRILTEGTKTINEHMWNRGKEEKLITHFTLLYTDIIFIWHFDIANLAGVVHQNAMIYNINHFI